MNESREMPDQSQADPDACRRRLQTESVMTWLIWVALATIPVLFFDTERRIAALSELADGRDAMGAVMDGMRIAAVGVLLSAFVFFRATNRRMRLAALAVGGTVLCLAALYGPFGLVGVYAWLPLGALVSGAIILVVWLGMWLKYRLRSARQFGT